MKKWVTEIRAINPDTGQLTLYAGPEVPGNTVAEAEQYCQENGLGYCKVIGELICEVPYRLAEYAPILGNEN